jgi:hypothetical protein
MKRIMILLILMSCLMLSTQAGSVYAKGSKNMYSDVTHNFTIVFPNGWGTHNFLGVVRYRHTIHRAHDVEIVYGRTGGRG